MKKKLLLVCTTVAFGILTVAGISHQLLQMGKTIGKRI